MCNAIIKYIIKINNLYVYSFITILLNNHVIQQLFRPLLVGVLHRFLLFEPLLKEWKPWEVVRAYDFNVDLTDGGNGKESIAYTLVRLTIVRQHNSWRDNTINKQKTKLYDFIYWQKILRK